MRFSRIQMIIITVGVFLISTAAFYHLLQKSSNPGQIEQAASFAQGEQFESKEPGTTSQFPLSREGLETTQEMPATPKPETSVEPSEPPLDVNIASKQDLLRIKGLSEQLVDAIILFREEGGAFKSVDDVQTVPGMTSEKFERVKPYLVVGGSRGATGENLAGETEIAAASGDGSENKTSGTRGEAVTTNSSYTALTTGPGGESPLENIAEAHADDPDSPPPAVSDDRTLDYAKPDKKPKPLLSSEKININTAKVSELTKLPGIGVKIGERIVEYRESKGPFTSINQITRVKGIGPKLFERIENSITIGD